jgi:hypothetical protein
MIRRPHNTKLRSRIKENINNYFELEDPTIIVDGNSPALLTGALDELVEKFEKGVYYVYGLNYTYHPSVNLINIFDRTNYEIGLEKNLTPEP